MASNIVPANVDGTYPKAGQDNSSQGFRDNFSATKTNFTEAKSEIEDIQTNKANLNATNDFAGNVIEDAELKDNSETVYAHGTAGGAITLDHENGHYQTITTNASVTLSFANLPATGKLARIVLDISCPNVAHTLTIPNSVLVADNVTGGDGSSDTITFPDNKRFLYEFLSPDGGTTILMHQIGKVYI
jgi:hypothetical protein|tara:strand:- start:16 stop:579 length:564 start_codon:yes stop_codon:yes gene_type:complete